MTDIWIRICLIQTGVTTQGLNKSEMETYVYCPGFCVDILSSKHLDHWSNGNWNNLIVPN